MAVFVIDGDQTVFHRRRGRDAHRMTVHAAFAKELAGAENPDHRLFALFGYDNNLDPAFLNIKDRVCHVSLGEDDLVFAKFKYGFPLAHDGEKLLGIECSLIGIVCHVRFGPAVGHLP